MRKGLVPLFLSALLSVFSLALGAAEIRVAPDSRVELMSLVFHLAGSPEYSHFEKSEYRKEISKQFSPWRDHAVVKLAVELRSKHGVSYDAVAGFAIRLKDTKSLEFLVPPDVGSDPLDKRWPRERIPEFVTALRDFVTRSGFNDFFAANRNRYAGLERQLNSIYSKGAIMPWFKKFFGDSRKIEVNVIPCALVRGGYGCSLESDGVFRYSTISGCDPEFKFDMKPEVIREVIVFSVHEFTHPNTNPWVAANFPQMEKAAQRALAPVVDIQRRQAYGTAATLMIETFNRAVVAVYVQDHFGAQVLKKLLENERLNGFLLVESLYKCIVQERKNGGDGWTFASSGKLYIEVINSSLPIVEAYEKEQRLQRENAPKITKIVPANGAVDVDPATDVVVVTFDRPMRDKCWSVVQVDPARYPKMYGKIHYNSDCTVLTFQLKLEPNHDYLMYLNRGRFRGFMSKEKYFLPDYKYTFRTGAAKK